MIKILQTFRDTNYCTLTIKRSIYDKDSKEILNGLAAMKSEVDTRREHSYCLLTPPQVKPANKFGLLQEEIRFHKSAHKNQKRGVISVWKSLCFKSFDN